MFPGRFPCLSIAGFVRGHLPLRKAAAARLFGLACGQALADGELKNGDFMATWRMRDDAAEQLIPKHWFASEPETTGNPWVKILEGDHGGVEIRIEGTSRFLFQDVRIDGTQTWTLKWKCQGVGTASISAIPRDDEGNIFPGTSKNIQLTDLLDEEETTLTMPAGTTALRIILGGNPPDCTVTFESVELTSSPN